jgi:hypothetical protein
MNMSDSDIEGPAGNRFVIDIFLENGQNFTYTFSGSVQSVNKKIDYYKNHYGKMYYAHKLVTLEQWFAERLVKFS